MNLEEFKTTWQEYDQKLDKQIQFNMKFLHKINLDSTKSSLDIFVKTPMWGVIIGFCAQLFLGHYIYNNFHTLHLVLPAALLWLFALLQVIFSIYQMNVLLHIEYDSPITKIQKTLETLKVHRIRYLSLTRFAYALLWLPVLMVVCKAFFDIDIYINSNQLWLASTLGAGFAFTVFGVWLSLTVGKTDIHSPFLLHMINNIDSSDITGKGLYSAISFLHDIEEFEKEM